MNNIKLSDPDPFLDFDNDKADKLIAYCEKLFDDEGIAHLHLLAAAAAICPHDEYNKLLLSEILRATNEVTL